MSNTIVDTLDEASIEADFQILNSYQAFSAELLRLSLLVIGGYGFLISKISTDDHTLGIIKSNKYLMISGVIFLIASSITALAHRYYSTDSLSHLVTVIRLSKQKKSLDSSAKYNTIRYESERGKLKADLKRCVILLIVSVVTLILGVLFFAISFLQIIFN